VDQYGNVQAIGGVNEKIEGFFRVCSMGELTGSQGVMIPEANVGDLQLASEVVEAVATGSFHIWAVDSIEDGIELLTGTAAGVWNEGIGWPKGSLFGACQVRLDEMVRLMRRAVKDGGKSFEPENAGGQDPPQYNENLRL